MPLCICCQPEGSGEELEQLAYAAGFTAFSLPLVTLQPDLSGLHALRSVLKECRNQHLGLIFSSKMAASVVVADAALTDHIRSQIDTGQVELFAVGAQTAEQLEKSGLKVSIIGNNDLKSLYEQIAGHSSADLKLVHVCGGLSAKLPGVRRCVVYNTEDLFPDRSDVKRLASAIAGHEKIFWMFTNARSAVRFGELIQAGIFEKPVGTGVAIGGSTMEQLLPLGFDRCLIGKKPAFPEMISVILQSESA